MKPILITKADGEHVPFDPVKLERSLTHAGASSTSRARVLSEIMQELRPLMTTEEIYRRAFQLLKSEGTGIAARYSVKRAVYELGPSGFPFEQFLSEVFRAHGWSTRTDMMLTGRCAPHEVDVVAEKNGKRIGVEAKFHNEPGGKTDIQVALYVHARYEDLKQAPTASSRVDEGWLVTNTAFTRNAIRYARCANLTLLGWDYPRSRGLMQMIEEAKVHPLTCLTTLSEGEKRHLLEQKVVLCKSVQTSEALKQFGISPSKIPQVLEEAKRLCVL